MLLSTTLLSGLFFPIPLAAPLCFPRLVSSPLCPPIHPSPSLCPTAAGILPWAIFLGQGEGTHPYVVPHLSSQSTCPGALPGPSTPWGLSLLQGRRPHV